jgi:uncharacterized protein YbjT (DUF2867 family)
VEVGQEAAQLFGPVLAKCAFEPVEQPAGVGGQGAAGVGEHHQAAAAAGRVGLDGEQVVPDEAGDELVGALSGGSEPAGERGRGGALGVQVPEQQGLRGREPGPAGLLQPVEQLPVEPAARPQQQQRERHRGHPVTLAPGLPCASGDLTAVRVRTDTGGAVRVVVLGAAGGVGRRAVAAAVQQGHEVLAAARSAPDAAGARSLVVDVRDAAGLRAAVDGVEAVLWCVGVTDRSGGDVGRTAMPLLLAACGQAGVRRLVSVSGAGVTLPGDDKGPGARMVSALTRRLARELVLDKEGEHAVLAASELDWTQVRPPRLVDRAPTGRWQLGGQAPGLTARPVAKADVALAMLALAGSSQWVRQAPFLTAG